MTVEQFSGEKIYKYLEENQKNAKLTIFNDYYEGKQWLNYNYLDSRNLEDLGLVRTTRSGKIGWKQNKENQKEAGIPQGLIKTWNLIKMMVDTYANYVRGNASDHTAVEGYDVSTLIEDIDSFVIDASRHLSIAGLCAVELDENGKAEIIDPRMIFPLRDGNEVVGMVKAYKISQEAKIDLLEKAEIPVPSKKEKDEKECWYWQVYYYSGEKITGIDTEMIETTTGDVPLTYVENESRLFAPFNFNNLPLGDVEPNIDIQDDINIFETDINIINRYVAMPMKKLADRVFEKMVDMGVTSDDMSKLREDLSRVSMEAGKLLSAPIENVDANPLADSTIRHLNDMLEQFYRQTGIPKSVFNSEGLGNIATDTIQFMTESLRKKVENKRTKITQLIKQTIGLVIDDASEIEVYFAPMYEPSLKDRLAIIESGARIGVPAYYLVKRLMELLGDSEEIDKILEEMQASNEAERLRIESMMRRNEAKSLPQTRPEKTEESDKFVAKLVAKAGL